ncbi:MAG: cytochrome-c oxidase, cbb3-type subunit III [Thiobacillaceae bacterium]|jgi:cytochrome c oxidase cbb3-type subunit 3
MNGMLDFTSDFWSWYITVITIVSLVGVAIFLYSQRTQRLAPGQKAEQMGHKWDGDLVELNNPLPSWWVKLFWITLIFAAVYLVLFPGLGSYKGILNWSSWGQYGSEMKEANAKYDPVFNQFLGEPIQQVAANKDAHDMGQRLFMTYCSQCHQSDGKGAKGFPNLTDNDWLYGGTPETIEASISNGRAGVMPAWEPILGADGVREVTNYVMSMSGKPNDANLAAAGKAKYETNCAACHGADGKGMQALGAPNLTDKVWLYGGSEASITESIAKGRNGMMPAQHERLGAAKVHLLAAYVWGLGGGQQPVAELKPAPEAAAPTAPEGVAKPQ